jgi:two-component system chemotaxis response regulator CheY
MARILAVDDSASMRQMVGLTLKSAGHEVVSASDGDEALALAKTSDPVDLVLTDVNMPNMDGITFVTHLKQNPRYKFTPVIMLTTEGQDAKKEQGRAAGAKAWIMKPFSPPILLDAVSKLILP